ncbi:copper-binding protein [Citrobacter sp. Awk 4]|uniref:copper-binding protein n=1 Tax=Citrobacter sp. Awk 4 TaxID=2963955 RepID=UPI0023023EA8|nr:copper-binding protein [Citrobacter sp. Awk 4]MDA8481029.1 copper-binding protein [Citrobacter sp. Awk 4]
MKKLVIAAVLTLSTVSSVWASQLTKPAMDMNQHIQSMIAHETMNNGSADAHQQMAEMHQKMMGKQAQENTVSIAKPFSAMNEHQQAAIAHSFTKNGQSGPHEQQSEQHMQMLQ